MTDNQEIEYILGIQIRRDRAAKTLTLSEDKYISDILKTFNMLNCHPVSTPLEAGIRYSQDLSTTLTSDEAQAMAAVPYKQAIGSLQYLVTCTRWDLNFAVNHLAQFMACPAPSHWLGVKRVLRYLKGTMNTGLIYSGAYVKPSTSHFLAGWSDADWAGDQDTPTLKVRLYF